MDIDKILDKLYEEAEKNRSLGLNHIQEAKAAIEQLFIETKKETVGKILGPDENGEYHYIDIDGGEREEWYLDELAQLESEVKK